MFVNMDKNVIKIKMSCIKIWNLIAQFWTISNNVSIVVIKSYSNQKNTIIYSKYQNTLLKLKLKNNSNDV